MKQNHYAARCIRSDGGSRRSGSGHWLSALVLAGLGVTAAWMCTPSSAFGFDDEPVVGRDRTVSNGEPPTAPVEVGDETIGTLPVLQGGASLLPVRDLELTMPGFFVEGAFDDVRNALISVHGESVVQVVPLDPTTGRVRMIFPGRVLLAFDRTMVESCNLEIGVWVPQPASYAYPIGMWGQRAFTLVPQASRAELPVSEMSAIGALQMSPLHVHAPGLFQSTDIDVMTTTDLLVLGQTHGP